MHRRTSGGGRRGDYAALRKERRIPAIRAAGPVALDGALDEAAWRDATIATGFLQNEPTEGKPATERTEVRVFSLWRRAKALAARQQPGRMSRFARHSSCS